MGYALLFRDDHLLAVAKPRGLPSLPGGGFLTHTLLHLVRRQWPEATPAHRLGRGTSGLVLFARTAAARRALAAAWRGKAVEKVYRALVRGVPAAEDLTIDVPIGLVPHLRLGQVHAAVARGKDAHTRARVIGSREGNGLLEVVIATGRPHQIRTWRRWGILSSVIRCMHRAEGSWTKRVCPVIPATGFTPTS